MRKIAIITGGTSKEREISIRSAKNMEIELSGDFEVNTFLFPKEWSLFEQHKNLYEVVIPIIHGADGEDGSLQKKLEEMNIPYLFSKPNTHAQAFDKSSCSEFMSQHGITCPKVYKNTQEVLFPVVIKPKSEGSSLGVVVAHRESDLPAMQENLMLEEYIEGREFTVGVIEKNGHEMALPVLEIKKSQDFLTFEEKYSEDNDQIEICPAHIPEDLSQKLQETGLSAHKLLGARHMTRSDFIVHEDGEIYFIETNTIPGMTSASLIIKQLKAADIKSVNIFKQWIDNIRNN